MKVSQMTQQTVSIRIRLLRQHCNCQLLRLRRRQITFAIFVGLLQELRLCLCLVAMHVSAIRVHVKLIALFATSATIQNKEKKIKEIKTCGVIK